MLQEPPRKPVTRKGDEAPAGEVHDSLFETLGPGLITGASDDDPSGIGTCSQAGAQLFRYRLDHAADLPADGRHPGNLLTDRSRHGSRRCWPRLPELQRPRNLVAGRSSVRGQHDQYHRRSWSHGRHAQAGRRRLIFGLVSVLAQVGGPVESFEWECARFFASHCCRNRRVLSCLSAVSE